MLLDLVSNSSCFFQTYSIRNFFGGGSVINNKYVLTAAHIFNFFDRYAPQDLFITYGKLSFAHTKTRCVQQCR